MKRKRAYVGAVYVFMEDIAHDASLLGKVVEGWYMEAAIRAWPRQNPKP